MCIVWVCVYFYLLSPFSILCSSYKRPLDFNNCLQFGKILMATSRICIVLCSLQGLQPDTLYFKAEWSFGPSTASYQLDDLGQDLWTLSSSSLQMGEQWQHPSWGFTNFKRWPNWIIYMQRLWKLWSAIPMYVITIFLTKFVIVSINGILICSSNTLLWLCLRYTYENAWVYPAGNVSYFVCLFIFNIMISIQKRFKAAWKDKCTISR